MPDPDLNFLLRQLDTIQRELRCGLLTLALRDEQRETSYQTMIETLTRQMVRATSAVDDRLSRLETMLLDIARKLDV